MPIDYTPNPRSWLRIAGQLAVTPLLLLVVRPLGRLLPLPVLWVLLWPFILMRSLWELAYSGPPFREFNKLVGSTSLPQGALARAIRLLLRRTQLNLSKLTFLWMDLLATPRWSCGRLIHGERIETGKPTIIALLHFGPMSMLATWLRARGRPVAVVTMKNRRKPAWYRRALMRWRDQAGGHVDVPYYIEIGQAWPMHDHLQKHGILTIAVDGGFGRLTACPTVGNLTLQMSSGALQLAALAGADVIPCMIHSEPFFGFTAYCGEPVPAEDIADRKRHQAACEHLFREFMKVIEKAPEECSYELLDALQVSHLQYPSAIAENPSTPSNVARYS